MGRIGVQIRVSRSFRYQDLILLTVICGIVRRMAPIGLYETLYRIFSLYRYQGSDSCRCILFCSLAASTRIHFRRAVHRFPSLGIIGMIGIIPIIPCIWTVGKLWENPIIHHGRVGFVLCNPRDRGGFFRQRMLVAYRYQDVSSQ